jgi:hypothetical protein
MRPAALSPSRSVGSSNPSTATGPFRLPDLLQPCPSTRTEFVRPSEALGPLLQGPGCLAGTLLQAPDTEFVVDERVQQAPVDEPFRPQVQREPQQSLDGRCLLSGRITAHRFQSLPRGDGPLLGRTQALGVAR